MAVVVTVPTVAQMQLAIIKRYSVANAVSIVQAKALIAWYVAAAQVQADAINRGTPLSLADFAAGLP